MIISTLDQKIKIVPNVEAVAREMTTTTQIGIVLNRVKALKPTSIVQLMFHNLPHLLKIAKKDFSTGLKVLAELEILKLLEKNKLKKVAIHQQIVDMAVALNKPDLLIYVFEMARNYCFAPQLITCNVGPLIQLLSRIKQVPHDLTILTPISSDQGVMNPPYPEIIGYLKTSQLHFVNYQRKTS